MVNIIISYNTKVYQIIQYNIKGIMLYQASLNEEGGIFLSILDIADQALFLKLAFSFKSKGT